MMFRIPRNAQHPPERQRTFGNVLTDAPAACRPNSTMELVRAASLARVLAV